MCVLVCCEKIYNSFYQKRDTGEWRVVGRGLLLRCNGWLANSSATHVLSLSFCVFVFLCNASNCLSLSFCVFVFLCNTSIFVFVFLCSSAIRCADVVFLSLCFCIFVFLCYTVCARCIICLCIFVSSHLAIFYCWIWRLNIAGVGKTTPGEHKQICT